MTTILLTVGLLGLAFALIATRILLVKDGEFKGTCSSNNPYLKNELGECTVCGKQADDPCAYDPEQHEAVAEQLNLRPA